MYIYIYIYYIYIYIYKVHIYKSHIKIANQKQNCDNMELAKEKRGHFLYRLFCLKDKILNICLLSQCIAY